LPVITAFRQRLTIDQVEIEPKLQADDCAAAPARLPPFR